MKDFFISYNWADRQWAEWIAWMLEEKECSVIIQAWDFRPGCNFILEMDKATKETDRTIAVLSPDFLKSIYTKPEWSAALVGDPTGVNRKFLPIKVRDCKPEGLLAAISYIDLVELNEEDAKRRLIEGVSLERAKPRNPPIYPGLRSVSEQPQFPGEQFVIRPSTPKGRLVNVPPLPINFISRLQYLEEAKEMLLSRIDTDMAITGTFHRFGLQGMGGIGKTVLASALAQDDQVREAFPDGIIWITLGQQPNLPAWQSQLTKSIDDSQAAISDIQDGRNRLSVLLADRSCLIILDDVWKMEHLHAFDILGPNCKMLITTRNLNIIRGLGAEEYRLDVLDEEKSLELLSLWSRQNILPPEAKDVAKECGNLPLALAMVGAMAKGKPDRWKNILHRLRSADLEKIKAEFPDYPYSNLMRAIEVSVESLEPEQYQYYLELAVFPEDIAVPLKALQVLWDMDEYDAQDLLDLLADRSLTRLEGSTLNLHDLQHDFVVKRSGNLKALHIRFLDAYKMRYSQGWPYEPNDGYFLQYLAYHLLQAGREEDLKGLLLDLNWIRTKLQVTSVASLISDYDYLPNQDELHLVQGAIRLSAHIFSHDSRQLLSQLYGRLIGYRSPQIQALMKQILGSNSDLWLCPITLSLIAPGGPLIGIFRGHRGAVSAVAVTPDGKKIVSGSDDSTLKVWDLETGQVLWTLKGHTAWIRAVVVTPDGRKIVSGSEDNTLKVWDLETGQVLWTLEGPDSRLKGHYNRIRAVAVTPDGKKAISGSNDHTLKVWDLERGKELHTLKGHAGKVSAVAVTPDGRKVVSGSEDNTLKVWDLETGQVLWTLEGHTKSVRVVAVTPNGKKALSGSDDYTLKVWDLETGKELQTLIGHTHSIWAIAVTPNGKKAISGSNDHTLKVWDLERGKELQTLIGHTDWVSGVVVTPDGRNAISSSNDSTLKVWDLERGKELKAIENHMGWVNAVAVTPNCKNAISGLGDNTLKVWDLQTGKELQILEGHTDWVRTVAVTPDGKKAISGSKDKTLKVWDLQTGKELQILEGHTDSIWAVAVTPNGRKAVSGSHDKTLKVWDLETGKELQTLKGHTSPVKAVALTPDGRKVVSGSSDHRLRVWDLETYKEFRVLRGHTSPVSAVAVTPDGRKIVSGSEDNTLKVWDLERGKELHTLKDHAGKVSAVAVTPDGRKVVSGSEDNTLKVWDLETGHVITTFTGEGQITAIAITSNGLNIIAGESSGRMHFLYVFSSSHMLP